MTRKRNVERGSRRLARVIVGGRADAAEGEHEIVVGERLAQHRREVLAIVAEIRRVVERKPARCERCDRVREMLVLAFARQDLVADDESAD